MRHKFLRLFRRWEMSNVRHSLVFRAWNLVTSCLSHGRGIAPIVIASQHENWTFFGIDAGDSGAAVETAKVEVEIAVEDSVGGCAVHVPDELFVGERSGW